MRFLKKLFQYTIVKYLLSYFLVFTAMIFGFFLILRNQIMDQYFYQLRENTQVQLKTMAEQLSDDILYLYQLDSLLIAETNLILFRYDQKPGNTYQAMNVLKTYDDASTLVDSITYMPRNSKTILSTKMILQYRDEQFLILNNKNDVIGFDPQPYYDAPGSQLIFLANGAHQYLLYFPQNSSTEKYVRFYSINLSEIEQRLSNVITNEVLTVALVSPDGQIVTGVNQELLATVDTLDAQDQSYTQAESLCIQQDIGNGYALVALLSGEALMQHINTSFSSAYVALLLLGVVGILLIFFVMRMTYTPLRKLAKKSLAELYQNPETKAEYIGLLDATISQKQEQNKQLQSKLDQYRLTIHKALLESTVTIDDYADKDKLLNIDCFFDPDAKSEIFVICMSNGNKPFPEHRVLDMFEKVLPGKDACILLEKEKSNAVFLINYIGLDMNKSEVLKNLLKDFYEQYGYLSAISKGSRSALDIPALYKNALMAKTAWPQTPVVDYSLFEAENDTLIYPHENLRKLSESLNANDFEKASEETGELFRMITDEISTSHHFTEFYIKSILVDMLTIINNSMDHFEVKFKSYSDLFFETLYLFRSCSYTENIKKIEENIRKLLACYEQEMMERIIHPIKVINIMEESYCDPDFSIYVLADKFHISVAYMSYLFKKEFDQNFSDYLWSLRLKKAKELLTQTKLSIDEVSIKVGYITPSGFRRKFKRDVGVSPTQYRETAKENVND